MSYRERLRPVSTADQSSSPFPSNKRAPSNASTISSSYSTSSYPSEISRTSTLSSNASSAYSHAARRRGKNEAIAMSPSALSARFRHPPTLDQHADDSFKSARLSLRPLSQAPNNSPPMTSRPKTSYSHTRSQTADATHDDPFTTGRPKTSYSHNCSQTVGIPSNTSPGSPRPKSLYCHTRGQSVDVTPPKSQDGSPKTPPRPSMMRPQSMLLSRADSVAPGSPHSARGHSYHTHSPLAPPDLESLQKSSTGHLKTLSKFAQDVNADEFSIKSPEQEVVGLHGRRRLKADSSTAGLSATNYGWSGRNWMDKQRQFLQAYEYLCHIGEAKEWIEDIIHKPIPPIIQLEEALRDGVTLAEIVEALYPDRRIRIFRHPKLQFRHSDNIATFFNFLGEVELPDLFRFELIDLYEKKNIPKVIYCIHALSWLLYRKGIVDFRIGNLVGQLEFEHHELEAMQKGLDKAGVSMPSFGNMGADFGVAPEPKPEPEPVETEEERITRELQENEITVVELQAQARGALVRMRLANMMQQLWDTEHLIVDLQSRIRGDFARQISEYRHTMRRFAINLQSTSRGFLVRQRQTNRESFWKSKEGDVLKLQSLIRAKKAQTETRALRSQLQHESYGINQMQAAIRGALLRKAMGREHEERVTMNEPVKNLQAAIMGMLLRNKIYADIEKLTGQEATIISLQAAARAISTREWVARQLEALQASAGSTTNLQSACRGIQLRAQLLATRKELASHTKSLTDLQAFIRASFVRNGMSGTLTRLAAEEHSIKNVQSGVRGMLLRKRIAIDRKTLEDQAQQFTKLQSCSRGLLFRKRNNAFLADLRSHVEQVVQLQSIGRAMLLRNDIATLLGELEAEEESIIAFQAAAQACLVRAKFVEKQRFFKENMEKVVKIQSFVRGRLQGEAYKSLTTGKNPPVNTVKNFVHLLNDSDFDFNEEIEFERLRKTVVQQVRQNEMAEQYIDQLDIKIALLVKNKITLDEVVKHQKNWGGHHNSSSSTLLTSNSLSFANQDLKALNKNSRKKLESYQQLFFTLQTQPQYLARMFRRIREQGTAEKDCKRIETLMMGMFGYAQKRREEYYLLKLISRAVREEVERCRTIQDYLRGNFFWSKILANYTRSPRDRKYLRELLGPLIRGNILEDAELDLESDPMQIYRSAINNEELRTGQPSRRPLDVPREMAIKDEETRALFIDHLRDLREISDEFLLALEELLHRMPYGIRFITQQTFEALCEQFPREPQENLLQVVGNWLWRFYLQPALTAPEQVGVIEKILNPLQKRNLGEVGKVLSQVAIGKLFGGDNIYLQPLNAYVENAIERMNVIFDNIINVPDAESTFDIDEFNDLYSKSKPTLYIKMADIFAIHNLVAGDLPEMCPGRDDMLREIVLELGSAKNNENELLGVTSAEIQMTLTPKLHEVEDPEADVKALFMETKRCVLYIIRVQAGPNLMDILVRPITDEDEEKWYALLQEEFRAGSNSRGAYADANTLVDITAMSYADLKRSALENIMHLEHAGRISRHNQYQDLLNAIAMDIRTKSRRRIQRQRELEGVRLTLGNLNDKAVWLEQQRKSYDNYIEQAMLTLQNKRGKKRFLLPFTKQYNHERELQRSGRKPKFGSYKYSARQLADKGVLISWNGYDARDYDRINLTISCDEVGVFFLEGSKGSIQILGASAQIPMDDLLQAQFNNHQFMNLFEGGVRLNVNLFLHLLYKKFYRTE